MLNDRQMRKKTNMIRLRNCWVKEWEGDIFQPVITKDERSSEDAELLLLELLLYNMFPALTPTFFQTPLSSYLSKAALHVDWGRGNPVCSCHRLVMNHYPVIWLPSPWHGEEGDRPAGGNNSWDFNLKTICLSLLQYSPFLLVKGQYCHPVIFLFRLRFDIKAD